MKWSLGISVTFVIGFIGYYFLAQAKADEIAKLMTENEQLKSVVDDLRVSHTLFGSTYLVCIYFQPHKWII